MEGVSLCFLPSLSCILLVAVMSFAWCVYVRTYVCSLLWRLELVHLARPFLHVKFMFVHVRKSSK